MDDHAGLAASVARRHVLAELPDVTRAFRNDADAPIQAIEGGFGVGRGGEGAQGEDGNGGMR